MELDSNFAQTHNQLSVVYRLKGNYAQSVEERAKFLELFGDKQLAAFVRESFAKGGWKGFLKKMISEEIRSETTYYLIALYHMELGEKDKAFAALNKAFEEHVVAIAFLKIDPRLDPLRSDPRFGELLRLVGFK